MTVAKIFEMHSSRRRNGTQTSFRLEPNSPDFSQLRRDNFLIINMPERVSRGSWLGSSWRTPLSAGAKLLPLIAVLWGLYLTGVGRRSGDANPKPDEQLATPHPSQPGQPIAKPSPIIPSVSARSRALTAPKQPRYAVAHSPASSVAPYPSIEYEATRKKVFGGCTGQLELTNAMLEFRCPDQADLVFPVAAIAKAHKDGVVLKSGEKYHFMIANHTQGQVEAIFVSWLNRVQQMPQPSRMSSF
jgi:hypothetical protein